MTWLCADGNEAAASVAYRLSDVVAIYPITPASPMGETADAWSGQGKPNLWGVVPEVVEMQSEAGAAGAVHGALQAGALATTFTASQGLLLMLPNMFKIAGELTPCVIHVVARTLATHALSIFGDHSDVMAARTTGFAMLCSTSPQEAQDMALVAHAATLESRVPFLHFFDGFRTSHEIDKIEVLDDADIRSLVPQELVRAQRDRGLSPDRPVLRGSAQNPDVFFQAREACNAFYDLAPKIVQDTMQRLGQVTGRQYDLVEYHGAPDAERVIVAMGSALGAMREAVDALVARGEKVGVVNVRLYRPFPAAALLAALPHSVEKVAVLDRTKEPGAVGEPLYQDVASALMEGPRGTRHKVLVGGRYGLSSKEFTPAMVAGVFRELESEEPKNHFTVGIVDDVTHHSIDFDTSFQTDTSAVRAVFYGLGSDGTVGANKSSVKIVGEATPLFPQGYFVYDSKKSGSVTVSHLRFDERPISSTYLIQSANFVACHQFGFLRKMDILGVAGRGATFLLDSPYDAETVWNHLPLDVQEQIIEKELDFYVIDARAVAAEVGMGSRINTVMQPCFFALSGILPQDEALAAIKRSIEKSYGRRGTTIVEQNFAAVDRSLDALQHVNVPDAPTATVRRSLPALTGAPPLVQGAIARMLAGEGDALPVSALPVDGTFPTATARYEKRAIAAEIPIWDPDICIDCGHCAIVCPHAAIQMKVYDPVALEGAPEGFMSKDFHSREVEGKRLTIQVAPDDCTACGICVDVCPAKSKTEAKRKAINMQPVEAHREVERASFDFFRQISPVDRDVLDPATIKGSQARQPLFEFSGACAGCGETPYLKLLTQLFGDRMVVANATGCSSIYGGNLPTTPWSMNEDGRGPAWANSLFEDNAEFGLGMRLSFEKRSDYARTLLEALRGVLSPELVDPILDADLGGEKAINEQRARVDLLKDALRHPTMGRTLEARELLGVADDLVDRSVWIIGGDGWAYDIGSSGLDHVLASGRNVNVLVLDTEVYSNTGGQASKATPRGAVAKFATAGKASAKKDLGMIAAQYGDVYVAQVALGANYAQTIKALLEAEAWPGPSLVIAYSTCIAHGIDMTTSMKHQKDAVRSGYWPLYRYQPGSTEHEHPLHLDSKRPSLPVKDFALQEARFSMLARVDAERSERLLELAQADVDERWRLYEQMAGLERTTHGNLGENGGRR